MPSKPFINPYLAGVLLGVVLFAAFAITHSGLGASGAVSRLEVGVLKLAAQSHIDRVGYLAAMGAGDRSPLDHSSVVMLLGTFAGGLMSSWHNRRLGVEVCRGPGISTALRLPLALLGGLIMGYGARMARGCTSGNALSGGAVLSAGSWAFMFAVFGGAYLMAWFVRKLWN